MSNDPNIPFQPPGGGPPYQPPGGPNAGPPSSGKAPGGGYSLLGLMLGLIWGLIAPPFIGGLVGATLAAIGVATAVQFIGAILAAIVIVIGGFILIIKQMDESVPNQAAVRTAMKVSLWTTLGLWGIGLLLFGACIALLAGAY